MMTVTHFVNMGSFVTAALEACFPCRRLFITLQSVSAILLVCFTAGCAGTRPTLKPKVLSTVNCTGVRGFLPQDQLKAQYIRSGYGAGGGLIGAIVDVSVNSGRQHTAEKRMQELRENVKDVDFRGLYWQAISNSVMGISWLRADKSEEVMGLTCHP
jgi:hypothetical protein